MRRLWAALFVMTAGTAGSLALASTPTCETLVEAFQASFDEAVAYQVGVAIEQGDREIAYELAQQTRLEDGSWASETIEQRGLRRPGDTGEQDGQATFGDVPFDCDGHQIQRDEAGHMVLSLPGQEGEEGSITGWSVRFDRAGGRWLPLELVAGFEARVLFIPVQGQFVTTLSDWRF